MFLIILIFLFIHKNIFSADLNNPKDTLSTQKISTAQLTSSPTFLADLLNGTARSIFNIQHTVKIEGSSDNLVQLHTRLNTGTLFKNKYNIPTSVKLQGDPASQFMETALAEHAAYHFQQGEIIGRQKLFTMLTTILNNFNSTIPNPPLTLDPAYAYLIHQLLIFKHKILTDHQTNYKNNSPETIQPPLPDLFDFLDNHAREEPQDPSLLPSLNLTLDNMSNLGDFSDSSVYDPAINTLFQLFLKETSQPYNQPPQ